MPEVITFGCRLNTFESEVIRTHAEKAGFDDVIVVNTCAVTTEAVRQAGQALRKAKREKPNALLIVTGCAAQIAPEKFLEMAEVDFVVSNAIKLDAALFQRLKEPSCPRHVTVGDTLYPDFVEGFEGIARAFVQIQNGCDNACTFCVVPQGRGASRSIPQARIIDQIKLLVERGYQEIVLTGVNITSYGRDLDEHRDLGALILSILSEIPTLPRLRLSSLDVADATPSFWEAIKDPRVAPHFHLSLQSGDNLILKRMRRRHTREEALSYCQRVRALRPEAVFGADFIVGFPTEDEGMFHQTLEQIEACDLTWLHIFSYSSRPGTPAARMPQVHGAIRKERARALKKIADQKQELYLAGLVGTSQSVLVEQAGLGCTPGFAKIDIPRDLTVGHIVEIECYAFEEGRVKAR